MRKTALVFLLWVACLAPALTQAAPIVDEFGVITKTQKWAVYEFFANESPDTYKATLTDLSPGTPFELDFLSVFIFTSTEPKGNLLVENGAQGSFEFDADPGAKLFAFVYGEPAATCEIGIFGLHVDSLPAPIPTTLLLLGSGLAGVLAIRRKLNKTELIRAQS